MGSLFYGIGTYYYIVLALQAICAIHCVRRGNQNKWLWLIIFLPLIGCIIYIFTEMLNKRDISSVQSNIGKIINPSGRIKELERRLQFSDTFDNRVALGDAYLEAGNAEQAISYYESSLTGIFIDNEYVISRLVIAYYNTEQYENILKIVPKVIRSADFIKSRAHLLYALALEKAGNNAEAEKEFKTMQGRYSNFEARYHYGMFLQKAGREQEAHTIFADIVQESANISGAEASNNRAWFRKAKEELEKINA